MDVDIVYTWCDDADEKWRSKRVATAARYGIDVRGETNGVCRYRSNDDLRFALRSVEQHAQWIRKVFLVVDDDASLPAWLNPRNPKLRIIRHSEIMPVAALPCFCSDNIEHSIVNIPDLAERFLLANDDTLFYRGISRDFFFDENGYPIFRLAGKFVPPCQGCKDNYTLNLQRTMDLFRACHEKICFAARQAMCRLPHHNIDAYCKSDLFAIRAEYAEEIDRQLRFPFRRADNVQRIIYTYESLQRGHGHLRMSSFNTSPYGGLLRRILPAWADSLFFVNDLWKLSPLMLKRFNPALICYNDTAQVTDEMRAWLKNQYAQLYPKPSSFERE